MATSTTNTSWIQKTADVCGGDACIRKTRVTVHGPVHYRQLGHLDSRILEAIQGLTQDDLDAAWEYYAGHAAEIEEAIRLGPAIILPQSGCFEHDWAKSLTPFRTTAQVSGCVR